MQGRQRCPRSLAQRAGEEGVEGVLDRGRNGRRGLEDEPHHRKEDDWPPDAREHDRVDPVGPGMPCSGFSGLGPIHRVLDPTEAFLGAVEFVAVAVPVAAGVGVVRARRRLGRPGDLGHAFGEGRQAGASARVDGHDRDAEGAFEAAGVHRDAAPSRDVDHGQRHDDALGVLTQLGDDVEAAGQVRRIGGDDDDVWPGGRVGVEQDRAGELLIRRDRVEGVGAGEVHQLVGHRSSVRLPPAAGHLDGGPRPVAHRQPRSGEGVEQRRLANVGGTREGDDERARGGLGGGRGMAGGGGCGGHCSPGLKPGVAHVSPRPSASDRGCWTSTSGLSARVRAHAGRRRWPDRPRGADRRLREPARAQGCA